MNGQKFEASKIFTNIVTDVSIFFLLLLLSMLKTVCHMCLVPHVFLCPYLVSLISLQLLDYLSGCLPVYKPCVSLSSRPLLNVILFSYVPVFYSLKV